MQEVDWVLYSPVGPLNLRTVMPLLEYIYALPQEVCTDRPLAPDEDELACSLLLCLPLPPNCPRLESLVELYGNPDYQKSRSLHVWRAIARSVARLIQDGG